MRFYKVFGVKTGPMGLKAKNYYFSIGISMNFVFPGHTELLPGHTELLPRHTKLLPGTQHGVLEAGPGVLEAGLGGLERLLGDCCVLLNGLGRFQNALGTFQGAPERESLIFHWFLKVFWGGPTHAPTWRVDCPTP